MTVSHPNDEKISVIPFPKFSLFPIAPCGLPEDY
jgi:hypothetical protein